MAAGSSQRPAPAPDCPLCPRLAGYRQLLRQAHPDWHNAPVPSFGDPEATLLVVGLAPGVAGANRTGRPFTGDFAGELLYRALGRHGFTRGRFEARIDDGLVLEDCRIANAVRCVPPRNRPDGGEVATCRQFLTAELTTAPRPAVLLALGRIAWDAVLRALALPASRHAFGHGAVVSLAVASPAGPTRLVGSYHTSRYNVNTGRLSAEMFDGIVTVVRRLVDEARAGR